MLIIAISFTTICIIEAVLLISSRRGLWEHLKEEFHDEKNEHRKKQ